MWFLNWKCEADKVRLPQNVWDEKKKIWHPKISEESVLKEIMTRLGWNKIKVWRIAERIPVKGRRWQRLSTPGLPDLMGWICNQTLICESATKKKTVFRGLYPLPVLIEVKRPGGVHRAAQTQFIEEAKADGCIAFFAESWNDCVQEFAKIGMELKTT